MKRLLGTALALAIALLTFLPGIAAARLSANRNQTVLRLMAVFGVIAALMSALPETAVAKLSANHNQTLLRA